MCVCIYVYIYKRFSLQLSARPSKINTFSIFICILYVNNPKRFVSVIPSLESWCLSDDHFQLFFMLLHQLKIELIVVPLHRLPIQTSWDLTAAASFSLPQCQSWLPLFPFIWSYVGLFTGCHRCFLPNVCFIWPSSTLVATTLTQNSCFWSIHPWGKSEYQRSTMALSTLTFTRLGTCRGQSPSSMFGIQESLNTICQIELDWIVPW